MNEDYSDRQKEQENIGLWERQQSCFYFVDRFFHLSE